MSHTKTNQPRRAKMISLGIKGKFKFKIDLLEAMWLLLLFCVVWRQVKQVQQVEPNCDYEINNIQFIVTKWSFSFLDRKLVNGWATSTPSLVRSIFSMVFMMCLEFIISVDLPVMCVEMNNCIYRMFWVFLSGVHI